MLTTRSILTNFLVPASRRFMASGSEKPTRGFTSLNDVEIKDNCNGKCMAEMIVTQKHTNLFGTLHGGMTATLVDEVRHGF